ncbi:MAG: hypothetical protein V4684_20880 [Pseudomonadota bacterium]
MKSDLPLRSQMLVEKFKTFPEPGVEAHHVKMRREVYLAFVEILQLHEGEIQTALDELARIQGEHEDPRSMAQDDFERLINQRVRELLEATPVPPQGKGKQE